MKELTSERKGRYYSCKYFLVPQRD